MAQLHQQHFETSQTQTKVLENIASASSFMSTVGCIPMMERTRMHVLNGCKDVKKLATTQGTILDRLCCKDLHRMWQKSSDPWMKNSHMINSLKRSSVHFWVSPALQQPLMNCPVYASNLAKTSSSTSTSTGTYTGGAPRSYHMKKHTSSHSASSALHCNTQ